MEFHNISFSYQENTSFIKALNGVIQQGKITSIIGPNGCGKSTLLSLLAKNQQVQSGKIILNGKELSSYKGKEIAQEIAVVYQQNQITEDMTVEELVRFGRIPYKQLWKKDTEEDIEAVEWALKSTNLEEKRTELVHELSGGQRQRVWIAMALAQKTNVLFLDEPTTYLDIYHQIELLELVNELNKQYGITIVMVLHDINQAYRYSDYIMLMKQGEIISYGTPNEVITEKNIQDIYHVQIKVNQQKDKKESYIIPIGI